MHVCECVRVLCMCACPQFRPEIETDNNNELLLLFVISFYGSALLPLPSISLCLSPSLYSARATKM